MLCIVLHPETALFPLNTHFVHFDNYICLLLSPVLPYPSYSERVDTRQPNYVAHQQLSSGANQPEKANCVSLFVFYCIMS